MASRLTFLSVCVGWVFFRAQSLPDAGLILRGMISGTAGKVLAPVDAQVVLACLIAMFVGHLFGTFRWVRKLEQQLPAPIAGATLALALTLYLVLLPQDGKGFIYFQF